MTNPDRKLRVGVIGAGYLGKFHAEKYAAMEDVELVGVVDTDPERAAEIARKFNARPFTSHEDIFGMVDAVSVAAPTPYHFDIAKDFLKQDIDVLIEKPMTTTLEEADTLIELAESRGLLIQVGQLERFNSAALPLRELVEKPMFIESHRLSIFKNRCTDVSVVLDLMIHDIDLILALVKADVTDVRASGIPAVSNHVDIANARLEFATGCVANVTASRISIKNERKLRLFQKDTYISVDFANRGVTVIRKTGSDNGTSLIPGMEIEQKQLSNGDALEQELRSFVRSVKLRQVPEVTGQMGRDALRVALNVMEQITAANRRFLGI